MAGIAGNGWKLIKNYDVTGEQKYIFLYTKVVSKHVLRCQLEEKNKLLALIPIAYKSKYTDPPSLTTNMVNIFCKTRTV